MVQEIIWTEEAEITYAGICHFLSVTWNDEIIDRFIDLVAKKLGSLAHSPMLGKRTEKIGTNVRQTVIHPNVVLNYIYYPDLNIIRLLSFWDTRSDH